MNSGLITPGIWLPSMYTMEVGGHIEKIYDHMLFMQVGNSFHGHGLWSNGEQMTIDLVRNNGRWAEEDLQGATIAHGSVNFSKRLGSRILGFWENAKGEGGHWILEVS